jgi:capsid protein
MLDERELWKLIQKFDIDVAERPIFENFLYMALLTGAIPLPLAKFEKFNKPVFRGRRWAWVDPMKEVQANALQVANKFTSRTRVIEDSDVDGDFEEVVFELAEEEAITGRARDEHRRQRSAKSHQNDLPRPRTKAIRRQTTQITRTAAPRNYRLKNSSAS